MPNYALYQVQGTDPNFLDQRKPRKWKRAESVEDACEDVGDWFRGLGLWGLNAGLRETGGMGFGSSKPSKVRANSMLRKLRCSSRVWEIS